MGAPIRQGFLIQVILRQEIRAQDDTGGVPPNKTDPAAPHVPL